MGSTVSPNFSKQFGERIEIVFADKPLTGEERRSQQKNLAQAIKAVMTAVLKREPSEEEFLGIVPFNPRGKRGPA